MEVLTWKIILIRSNQLSTKVFNFLYLFYFYVKKNYNIFIFNYLRMKLLIFLIKKSTSYN